MQSGEGCWRHTPTAAVRPVLVVVGSPCGDGLACLLQRFEPVLIKAFIAKGAFKALDVRVLGRAAWLNQDVFDAVLLRLRHERPASEFWSVVGSHFLGVAPKHGCTVQQARDVITANAEVSRDVYAFMAEVVRHREAFDAP